MILKTLNSGPPVLLFENIFFEEKPPHIPHSDILKIFHINVQSIRNKVNTLEAHVFDNNIDVLCINEHWLSQQECAY